jgi:hypothetical protein
MSGSHVPPAGGLSHAPVPVPDRRDEENDGAEMDASAARNGLDTCDVGECAQFLRFWAEVTGTPHITLIAILPDAQLVHARTFSRGEEDAACAWITDHQRSERNIYWQPNETRPDCTRKPGKSDMVAALCRHCDIDPDDARFPLAEERERLSRLATFLSRSEHPPTCVIDSGNGVQALWATQREALTPEVIARVEAETAALERSLGAGGTHNVDRLLRLPGTLNFPNRAKLAKGRGVTRARLIFAGANLYRLDEAGGLGSGQLIEAGLVRPRPTSANAAGHTVDPPEVAALIRQLEQAQEARTIGTVEDLPDDLRTRLTAAMKLDPESMTDWDYARRKRLANRWAGLIDDLSESGRDVSRSAADMSLAAMLKAAGFSHVDTALILLAFRHGKANHEKWPNETLRLRHVARSVLRSHEPPPEIACRGNPPSSEKGKAQVEAEPEAGIWPDPVDILADQDPGAAPILAERHIPAALWPFVADTAERMGVATSTVALCAIVACAAAISEEWELQPKRHDWTWTERACLWGAPIGPPGIMKTPVIALATAPFDSLEIAAREQWNEDMAAHRRTMADWKAAGEPDPEPRAPRMARYLVQSTTVEALQEVLRDDASGKFYAPLGKVLSKQDELAEFLAGMDRYSAAKGGGDRGAWLRLYDGGRFTIDRIGRGSFTANNWSACLIGGIQPEPIQQIARNATDDGLLQRFMFDVPPPRGPGQDRGPDRSAIEAYRSLFPALAALRPARTAEDGRITHVVLHADAHASRESIDATVRAMSLWPDASPQLQSAFSKWQGLFARLCLTFHLVEIAAARARDAMGPPLNVISPETAARVRIYMREILAPMLLRAEAVMFASRQTTHASWIANFIIAGGLDRVAMRDIVQNYRQLRAPEHRDTRESTMDSLCTVGWLRPEPTRSGAPGPTAWRVNPAVHVRFAERAAAERARRDAVKADIAAHVAQIRQKR